MSTVEPVFRHPLGLPAGSVRSLLTLMVLGLICGLVFLSTVDNPVRIPPYLIYLLFLMLGSFFSAHGSSIKGEKGPLYLPHGTIRFLLFVGLAATITYKVMNDQLGWERQFEVSVEAIKHQVWTPLYVIGGFFTGIVISTLAGRARQTYVYQDLLAWVSLVAMLGMTASVLIELVINPSLHESSRLDLPAWDGVLASVVAFYFGARS